MSATAVGEMPDPNEPDGDVIDHMEEQVKVSTLLPEIRLYQDRCDFKRCEAQAFMIAQSLESQRVLTFCGHHGRMVTPGLVIGGFVIEDQFQRLTSAPAL